MASGGIRPIEKGRKEERTLVRLLRSLGLKAKRVPLSGAAPNFPGDLVLEELPGWRVEVKYGQHVPARLFRWLEERELLLLRRPRAPWLVVLRLEEFVELLKKKEGGEP